MDFNDVLLNPNFAFFYSINGENFVNNLSLKLTFDDSNYGNWIKLEGGYLFLKTLNFSSISISPKATFAKNSLISLRNSKILFSDFLTKYFFYIKVLLLLLL